MKKKIACIQLDIEFGNPKANYEKVESWLQKAVKQHCDIAVLPELWTTGYDLNHLSTIADDHAKTSIAFLSKFAKQYGIDLIGGSVANKKNEQFFNTMLIINRNGEMIKQYSKLHLFKLMDEHLYLSSGNNDGVFQLNDETFAGVICYDIRFPEWIRKQALQGAKALFVSAEWPHARLDHWRTLLLARAIENQCFIIACNRAGRDPNNLFAGHSMIIDPWGKVLAEGTDKEELVTAEIDLSVVTDIRNTIPVFSDRLPEFY
ncbi:carbon-nitrogen family hydrolase [Heyndrickxia ginsengihumi]|uniref:Hydrolase n=1 Tax=Heyndrickxia ginsengihumi TaxID=363870 RepID=A0A0A6XXP3_9BACI|nr:carbon-nitrogen family hydrolase [Heyndrickxia ginsengihumi]KHD84867.1 hydrolase [Heyndrickxia ginsengihumi]MBE6183594.1 carbon-nitrogen family hydrolase [Bacillus sp. (in: firmicutes)]MCM3024951.1 carbon-nitrogen family hydrolase [Heyndrickxia ginsengihumi]NEY18737.1 carbon-nitrogen family hydrolase [Heyndrickxia ginsengihumi]